MQPLRLTTVMGVAQVLLGTVGPRDAVLVLEAEFGWDAAFQALSLLRGPEATQAFALAWESLLTGTLEQELGGPGPRAGA